MGRNQRDREVIEVMVGIYCRGHHNGRRGELCGECKELLDYATKRLKKCPIDEEMKTSCRLCKIHCYDHSHSQRVRDVMRYSGWRMMFHSPIMAIRHLIEERKRR
ncbi:MAG: nitrous oxide-stimulated promoter family protein [Rikenellaceae bacterium]